MSEERKTYRFALATDDNWKQKLDTIASANGCKVTDYNLAWYSKQKGFREEWLNVLMYFSAGMIFGAVIVKFWL